MVKKRTDSDDVDLGSRPGCFCKMSNCEDQGRRFEPIQNTYETVPQDTSQRYDLRSGQRYTRNEESGKWEKVTNKNTTFDEKKCLKIFIPLFILLIIVVILIIYVSRDKDSSSFPPLSEKTIFRSQLEASANWRVDNRYYLGLWLGCYRNLCKKTLSDYDNQTLAKVVKTVQTQFSEIILNPQESSNYKILNAIAGANQNGNFLSVLVTFHGLSDLDGVLDTANKQKGIVKTLILQGSHSLYDSNLLDKPEVVLPTLVTIKEEYFVGTSFKLGLLLDRNDCLKWEGGGGQDVRKILEQVDKVYYRTQHEYYKYQSPRHEGARRVPDNERQLKSADPVHYHGQMIQDLIKCERSLRGRKHNLEFIPVINCDKYWGQSYINLVTHEHKNLENLVKCWQLAGEWGKREGRKVVILVDREIEKHDWFGQDLI